MKIRTLFLVGTCVVASARATVWYVDDKKGDDAANGRQETAPVRTLARVNKLPVKPGDRVLFKRGGLWRGGLRPKSGEPGRPVIYSSYGTGPKPILQQSVDRSSPADWVEEEKGIWATRPRMAPVVMEQIWDGSALREAWGYSYQEGNEGTVRTVEENGMRFVRVSLTRKVHSQPHYLQLWGPKVEDLPDDLVLRLKVRSSKPFQLGRLTISLNRPPWTVHRSGLAKSTGARREIGSEWSIVEVPLERTSESDAGWLHFSIGDVVPEGAVFDFVPLGLWRTVVDRVTSIPHDVGIFICDHGRAWGVKKWHNPDWRNPWPNKTSLTSDLDFWYVPESQRVFVKYPRNPGEAFGSIELALTRHVVDEGGCHDIVYDGLCVRYGAAHGFGGGATANIVIRNCDLYWIGGGLQFWQKNAAGEPIYPVRYGNAIEFWASCRNNLVERNRIWQIYDAALTNQTKDDPQPETEVTWRDNVIWQSEYSFEYWNHDPRSFTRNVLFEHNTCVDAGYGWAHDQRPDPNGAHLMFYDNAAPTTNFVVRNNLFVRTRDRASRFFNDWRARNPEAKDGLFMDHNLYWIPSGKVSEFHVNGRDRRSGKPGVRVEPGCWNAGEDEFRRYQREFALDAASVYGEPQFVDESRRDYRLKAGTFGSSGATDGGPLGARDMPGLDQDQSLR